MKPIGGTLFETTLDVGLGKKIAQIEYSFSYQSLDGTIVSIFWLDLDYLVFVFKLDLYFSYYISFFEL